MFCLSKCETAFGNFFSATYSNDFSDADQAKQPNLTEQTKQVIVSKIFFGHVIEGGHSTLTVMGEMTKWPCG